MLHTSFTLLGHGGAQVLLLHDVKQTAATKSKKEESTVNRSSGLRWAPCSSCTALNSRLEQMRSTASESIKYGNLSLVGQAYFGMAVLAMWHDTSAVLMQIPCCSFAEPIAEFSIMYFHFCTYGVRLEFTRKYSLLKQNV